MKKKKHCTSSFYVFETATCVHIYKIYQLFNKQQAAVKIVLLHNVMFRYSSDLYK